MKPFFVRQRILGLVGIGTLITLGACEDKRTKDLHAGMTRDSAITALAQQIRPGSGPDSLPNVYTRERYLVRGQSIEVLFFTPNNEKLSKETKDTLPMKRLTEYAACAG